MPKMNNRICRQCGKQYSSNCALRRHISSAHSNNVYKCKFCPATYKRTDNLNKHLADKHGEGNFYLGNDWGSFPNHKSSSTTELREINSQSRACSPINELEGLPTLMGTVRDINPPNQPKQPKGKVMTGKVIKSWRKERPWLKTLQAEKPLPKPKVDIEKIRETLAQPKKLVKFPISQTSMNTDPLELKRLPTRPALFNPQLRPVKYSVANPAKKAPQVSLLLPNNSAHHTQEHPHQNSQINQAERPKTVPSIDFTVNNSGRVDEHAQDQATHTQAATANPVKELINTIPCASSLANPKPGCSGINTKQSELASYKTSTNTLDKFLVQMRPGNIFKPFLQKVQSDLHQVDSLFSKFGSVGEDLHLSESSSDDSDSELEDAACQLEKVVLKMD